MIGELVQKFALLIADRSCAGGTVHIDNKRAGFQLCTETVERQGRRQLIAHCLAQSSKPVSFDCQEFELGTIAGEQRIE